MKLAWVREPGFPPAILIAPARLPGRLVGLSLGPVIVVEGRYAHDRPTLIHELEHCRQFWRGGLIIHFVRYWLSRPYRMHAEFSAFALELLACSGQERDLRLEQSAQALAEGYRLTLEPARCRALLQGYLDRCKGLQEQRPVR